jgi:hypothetical protein
MTESLEAWLDRHVRDEDAHAHQMLSTAKLVTTFAAATAATFVATALQVGGKLSCWDGIALVTMLGALVLVVVVVCHKRKIHPLVDGGAFPAPNTVLPNAETLDGFRTKVRKSAATTRGRANRVFVLMLAQIVLCIIAIAMAVVDIHLHGG